MSGAVLNGLRGRGLMVVVALLSASRPAIGQQEPPPSPRLEVTVGRDSAMARFADPLVRTVDLLQDGRWVTTLQEGLPVRLSYRLELWRARSVWFDQLERFIEWDVVVRWEPVLFEFSVRTIAGSGARERRYATRGALAAALATPYRIALRPTAPGDHYYVGSLSVSTLSDSDIQELERFLRNDPGGDASEPGGGIGRQMTRLLLRIAGLPRLRLEARTPVLPGPQ